MSHFAGIVPCGITDGTVTSMQAELGETIDLDDVQARLAVEFKNVFRNTAAPHEQS
jgi:lipoate-protein ligase B